MEALSIFGDLPDEILLKILSCHTIAISDLGRVATTCSRLRDVVATPNLWRLKLEQHWPKIWDQLPCGTDIKDWQEEVYHVVTLRKKVQEFVSGLSRSLYQYLHLTTPVYAEVDALTASSKYALLYVYDALRKLVDKGPQYDNMTEKYYASKLMSHVHQNACRQEWEVFLSQPANKQSLEVGAVLVAKWFQAHTDISVKQIHSDIDALAKSCFTLLHCTHSDHPAFPEVMLSPYETPQDPHWSRARCHQVLDCVNKVLFQQVKLAGNFDHYYNLKNSLINEVLETKKGIPITLSIIYTAVCHRMGLLLEPVNYPSHFVLRWKIPGQDDYEYIDAFYSGRRLTGHELMRELMRDVPLDLDPSPSFLAPCSNEEVFQRMIRNIMNVAQMQPHASDHMELFCSATELMSLLSPNDRSVQELLLRIYQTLEIHYDRIIAGCRRLLKEGSSPILKEMLTDCERILESQNETPNPITVNRRSKEIKYATGLVMKHKKYLYTCVIFGWDKTCRMSRDWVQRMGVHNLLYKTEQPFYNVLVYDGSNRYAAQENLEIASDPEPVTHSDVGKYFKTFTGTYYIPNEELQEEYPEDEITKHELLQAQGLL